MNPTTRTNSRELSPHSRESTHSGTTPVPKSVQKFRISFPMTSQELKDNLGKYLKEQEKRELKDFKTVYFFNFLDRKLPGGMDEPTGA